MTRTMLTTQLFAAAAMLLVTGGRPIGRGEGRTVERD